MELSINVIVAYSDNFVIGNNNDIPWLYKEDLKYFQNITTSTTSTTNNEKKNVVIMGYNTYISLNSKKLKNRVNIVITSKTLENDIDLYFVYSLGTAIEESKRMLLNNIIEKIFIIGGESIYTYFFKSYYYKFLDKIYITRIHKSFEGNKFFYGLEEKFYYKSVEKSLLYPEIEYRVLQYSNNYNNIEKKYLNSLKYMLRDDNIIYDSELGKEIVCSYKNEFELEINLNECFPLFSFMKDKKDITLNMLISLFDNIELKKNINNIMSLEPFAKTNNDINIDNSLLKINLLNIKPFNSIYNFDIENNKLSCTVEHTKGNMITEVLYNIMFTSLMVIFICNSSTINLIPHIIKYKCNNSYYLETDNDIIEKIAWNVPDVLPLLRLNEKKYKKVDDYCVDDLIFLGLNI